MSQRPVEVWGLVRSFGDIQAVKGIDLYLDQGEVFGFLGPNGAGKTTTVRMLTTLLVPTEGSATVAGFDVVKQADKVRENIGVALQEASLDPIMTGREMIRMQAVLHGIPKARALKRSNELLERVGLTDAANRQIRTYSGGMRRRLDLAASLVHDPKVLFLDEPTTGLDPISRLNLWEEVRSLNQEKGTTIFLTTQYLEEADELAGRIAIIDDGKIVREGTPANLKAQVRDPTLRLEVEDEMTSKAQEILLKFGDLRPGHEGVLSIGLSAGVSKMAEVIRALDLAGIVIKHLELEEPNLDDVFADATGYSLEEAVDSQSEEETKASTS